MNSKAVTLLSCGGWDEWDIDEEDEVLDEDANALMELLSVPADATAAESPDPLGDLELLLPALYNNTDYITNFSKWKKFTQYWL